MIESPTIDPHQSVGIGVVDHETSPLRHLSEMPERVVEVLDRSDVGFRRKVKRVLESCGMLINWLAFTYYVHVRWFMYFDFLLFQRWCWKLRIGNLESKD